MSIHPEITIKSSPTYELLCKVYDERIEAESSNYKRTALKIRKALFCCLGTKGFGMNDRNKDTKNSFKAWFITYASNTLACCITPLTACCCSNPKENKVREISIFPK